ncbi:hypothetical protein Ga0061079_10617 [Apibacter mensalis]|uniref:Uncharacterized protein n=1 Tax=Apibacter mensalis TaxID=1586267 RepID=A0A0X3APG9_9FLAO|nr:hypothetical protein Ga0061079_10617 [Apibacter mensalis]
MTCAIEGRGIFVIESKSPLTPLALKPRSLRPRINHNKLVPLVSVWQIWRTLAIEINLP